ncbi:hypothetical protein [Streptomyces sp. NPDC005302]|uniref:hypothetical protein n=1 Tax=Streptomyces sp. NPDC005302 TaxID=3154675 RepID=UPI0033A6AAFE
MAAAVILALLFGLSAGWVWGHCTARIVYKPIGADAHRDELLLDAHEARQFRDIEQHFDGTEWRPEA